MADNYQQIREKIVALRGKDSYVEAILREMVTADGFGQADWDVIFAKLTVGKLYDVVNVDVTDDYTADVGQFLTVTCSTKDITVSLPSATSNEGGSIYIHKADATVYKVLTSVKDIAFQNSTMHLKSNGVDWMVA